MKKSNPADLRTPWGLLAYFSDPLPSEQPRTPDIRNFHILVLCKCKTLPSLGNFSHTACQSSTKHPSQCFAFSSCKCYSSLTCHQIKHFLKKVLPQVGLTPQTSSLSWCSTELLRRADPDTSACITSTFSSNITKVKTMWWFIQSWHIMSQQKMSSRPKH